jgi:uncharacterized protein YrrD
MLILSEAISGKKVMSLHAGGAIATISEPIIDPVNLKIVAFSVTARGMKYFSALHSNDIREWGPLGAIVNSEDALIEVDENMPIIKNLVEEGFKLANINVRTESGKRIGKVRNFIFESDGYFVVKINIESRSLMGLISTPKCIERDSIVNVTKKYIVISDSANKIKAANSKKAGSKNIEYGFDA